MTEFRDIMELAAIERAGWKARMDALVESGTPLNADTASFSAAMKTKFIGPIRDGLHKGKVLLFGSNGDNDGNPEGFKGILTSAENIDFVGNEFRIPIKASRNQAVGFRSENETLPNPGAGTYTYLTEPMRSAYGVFNITGQLLKASETNEGAFKQAFKEELDDTVLSSKLDFNRAAYGTGVGTMATTRLLEAIGQTVVDVDTTINFRGNEVVDGVTLATGVVENPARTVTAVDRVNRTITVSPALTVAMAANTTGWVRASSNSTVAVPNNSWNKEIQGLQSIVSSTGTLHGINPATYPFWKSYQAAIAGPISDAVLRDAVDGVGFESGVDLESGDFALVTTRGIRRRYADTLLSVKRFSNVESTTLRGGFKVLEFDGLPIFTDDQCPVGNVFGLSLKDLFWAQESDWEWMDQDGSVLKHEPGKDRYIAYLFAYKQLGATRRNTSFRLTGVTDDVR